MNNFKIKSYTILSITGIFSVIIIFALSIPAQAKLNRYLSGNRADVNPPLSGFVYNLGGGGIDVDAAIQWMINTVRGCTDCNTTVDVVVIRDTGGNGYNQPIIKMNGVDSVETLVISQRQHADRPEIIKVIQQAEVVFFAGGDQCQYVRNYRNTGVETAVKSVINRGGAVGGTSAGAMIQSDFVFNACGESVTSKKALLNPYEDISLTSDFLDWKYLENTIIDTHFKKRDRRGRLITFLARLIRDGDTQTALGIGIDEGTSLIIDQMGLAQVIGNGFVEFIWADHLPEKCEPQIPLTLNNYQVWRKSSGETFDLAHLPTHHYQQLHVIQGKLYEQAESD
ncbi:MAG: Type 1 glutamine amidotransferase-like domain-containing protein [Microcoleaceae cyanobacterium]